MLIFCEDTVKLFYLDVTLNVTYWIIKWLILRSVKIYVGSKLEEPNSNKFSHLRPTFINCYILNILIKIEKCVCDDNRVDVQLGINMRLNLTILH